MAQAAVSKRSAAPAASLTRPRTSPSLRRVSTIAPCAPKSRARCIKAMAFLGVTSNGNIKQAERVKPGNTLPLDHEFMILDVGTEEPRSVKLSEIMGSAKKAILFGLPGAYTTLCSSKHVPDYNQRYPELKEEGIDFIGCTSVNDPWVMREWSIKLNNNLHKVAMLADGEATWHARLGLLQHIPGLGVRAMRYSLLVEDGKVVKVNVEEAGAKSYKISGPQTILNELGELKGQSA